MGLGCIVTRTLAFHAASVQTEGENAYCFSFLLTLNNQVLWQLSRIYILSSQVCLRSWNWPRCWLHDFVYERWVWPGHSSHFWQMSQICVLIWSPQFDVFFFSPPCHHWNWYPRMEGYWLGSTLMFAHDDWTLCKENWKVKNKTKTQKGVRPGATVSEVNGELSQ